MEYTFLSILLNYLMADTGVDLQNEEAIFWLNVSWNIIQMSDGKEVDIVNC